MSKRSTRDIKRQILRTLIREGNLTFAQLERKANTGYITIKINCEELQDFGAVSIIKKEKHTATGRPYFLVSITKEGKRIVNEFK